MKLYFNDFKDEFETTKIEKAIDVITVLPDVIKFDSSTNHYMGYSIDYKKLKGPYKKSIDRNSYRINCDILTKYLIGERFNSEQKVSLYFEDVTNNSTTKATIEKAINIIRFLPDAIAVNSDCSDDYHYEIDVTKLEKLQKSRMSKSRLGSQNCQIVTNFLEKCCMDGDNDDEEFYEVKGGDIVQKCITYGCMPLILSLSGAISYKSATGKYSIEASKLNFADLYKKWQLNYFCENCLSNKCNTPINTKDASLEEDTIRKFLFSLPGALKINSSGTLVMEAKKLDVCGLSQKQSWYTSPKVTIPVTALLTALIVRYWTKN